ncbi:hypothetical protein B566_EDAN001561 [Ephemera danica]|nr:hypothetical protein B566_EDAN001561 [Ephemera danica]
MSITWNNRLRSTAGFCYNQKKAQPGADFLRTSRIELSGKAYAGRLRDTLIHEMCHAATWVISGTLGGHGPIWKRWTYKARRRFPELPEISRCHSYKIETKYTYKCTKCSYSFGRHTKSLDLERKVCGLCRGRFEILVRGGSKAQPSPSKPPNVFALYVKEHYKVVKAGRKSLKHADVMKMLSQKFSEHKLAQKQA